MHDDRGARVGGSGHSRHRYGRKSCTATRRRSVFVFNYIEGPEAEEEEEEEHLFMARHSSLTKLRTAPSRL